MLFLHRKAKEMMLATEKSMLQVDTLREAMQ